MEEELKTIVMDRYTQFKSNFPVLREPRWYDNTFLIAADVALHNKIVCIYQRPDGSRMFPDPLYIAGHVARKYKAFSMPTKAGGVMRVRAVPIKEFKFLKISERSLYEI